MRDSGLGLGQFGTSRPQFRIGREIICGKKRGANAWGIWWMFLSQPHQKIKMSEEDLCGASLSQQKKWSYLYMDVSKNNGTPQIIHFNRVFHYFHHPFWGKHLYFWKHPYRDCFVYVIVFFGGKPSVC